MKMVAISAPNVHDIWHTWMKGPPAGTASLEEKIAIQDGKQILPPDCNVWFDVNPTFDPSAATREEAEAAGAFVAWPTWTFERLSTDGKTVLQTAILNEQCHTVDGFVSIQSADTEGSKYRNSKGYAPIVEIDGWSKAEPTQIRVTVAAGGFTGKMTFPWCSPKDGAKPVV